MNIVILGSCRYSPYIITAPNPLDPRWTKETHELFNNEEQYEIATKIFYPAIDNADFVIVYLGDKDFGNHTYRDYKYAFSKGKRIIIITDTGIMDLKGEST